MLKKKELTKRHSKRHPLQTEVLANTSETRKAYYFEVKALPFSIAQQAYVRLPFSKAQRRERLSPRGI